MAAIRLTPTIILVPRHDWKARQWSSYTYQSAAREMFLHHSTDRLAEHVDTLAEQGAMCRAIQRYHMDSNGWDDIGYHYLVFQAYGSRKYARIFEGRPMTHVPAAQLNHNTSTIAVCVFGNFDHDDTVKRNTRHAIEVLINTRVMPFGVRTIGGHRDVVSTECPGDTLYKQIPQIAVATGMQRI